MLKKVNTFINMLMVTFPVIFAVSAVLKYSDYKSHPDLYAAQSAPWYLNIQITGILLVIILIVCVVIKLLIRSKMKE